jgi:Holliday junction resolvasome RuvABC DNA-binding subunit
MATVSKTEKIIVGIDDQVVELTGADKEAFLAQRALDQAQAEARQAEAEARKQTRISALQKLGLTEEEINAIL